MDILDAQSEDENMSATATTPNLKEILTHQLQQVAKAYISDFGHIPEEKRNAVPMGKARTPHDFTVECVGLNRWVARTLRGETPDHSKKEERQAYLDSLTTSELATNALNESVAEITAALANLTDEDLAREITMPWGSPGKLCDAPLTAAFHMAYHMGQLNYIQCLYGDDQMHWE
jgi:hypothetical protein